MKSPVSKFSKILNEKIAEKWLSFKRERSRNDHFLKEDKHFISVLERELLVEELLARLLQQEISSD